MHRSAFALPAVALLAALTACQSGTTRPPQGADPPGKYVAFQGTGPHSRPIGTSVPGAQAAFDQGLAFAYAFNHDEAWRCFTEVTRLDPQSPMGYWGVALSRGPHINNPAMPPERERAGWEAAQRAVELQQRAGPADRALIAAMAQRYDDGPAPDRAALDKAYAQAMREAWQAHQQDADVGALCAEALMDLHPWDLWTTKGEPKEGAEEIVALLERVRGLDPDHPGALHLYIHAVEASTDPGRALAAADRLRDLVPVSGHMRHMPSHIDVLLGHWDEAITSNERAIAADTAYRVVRPQQEFHHVYMAHNLAMLAFAAMMDGRSAEALAASRQIAAGVPADVMVTLGPALEPNFLILYDTLVRFGLWEELLAEPEPAQELLLARAMWHHGRGVALAALGRVPQAEEELAAFRAVVKEVPEDRYFAINPAHAVFAVADLVLAGEIAYRKGDRDAAVAQLSKAIELEDQLAYMEPPEWPLPVRHALGAILLEAGRVAEAEQAYREDLQRWPDNGWSLHGLAQCLHGRPGGEAEALQVEQRFKTAWAQADVKIASSCLCVARGNAAATAPAR